MQATSKFTLVAYRIRELLQTRIEAGLTKYVGIRSSFAWSMNISGRQKFVKNHFCSSYYCNPSIVYKSESCHHYFYTDAHSLLLLFRSQNQALDTKKVKLPGIQKLPAAFGFSVTQSSPEDKLFCFTFTLPSVQNIRMVVSRVTICDTSLTSSTFLKLT